MLNKDYIRMLLNDEKKLMPIKEVRTVNVPKFDELSVKKLFPLMRTDLHFMRFFPDNYPEGRWPDRRYFFNVLNTLQFDYL